MGRRKTKNLHHPPRFRFQSGQFWHVAKGTRKWTALGRSESEAVIGWAAIEARHRRAEDGTVAAAIDRYVAEVLPSKRPETQKSYRRYAGQLRELFGGMRLHDVRPMHVAQLLDKYPAPVAANRAKAMLSTVYAHAMRWGWVDANPCAGVRRNPEKARDRYVDDDEYASVRNAASPVVAVVMDFAYLTGLRQADVLKVRLADIKEDGFYVVDQKTGARGVYEITPALAAVIDRARGLRRPVHSLYLFAGRRGQPYTSEGFRAMWQRLMRKAVAKGTRRFTFHDIRAKHATDANAKGLNPQLTLGHATPVTTARYIRSRAVDKRRPLA